MLSILMGLLTACFYAVGPLATSRTAKTIGPYSTVGGITGVGLLITLPWAVREGVPPGIDAAATGWLVLAGVGNVAGIVFGTAALRVGKVGVVAPILATEGAIAAVLAALLGEPLGAATAAFLAVIVVGIVLAASAPDPEPLEHERPMLAAILATLGALAFGSSLFAAGHLSDTLPISWILLPARIVGVLVFLLPLLALRRFRLTRAAAPLIVLVGFTDVFALIAFSFGAAQSVAVTAVLASLFAPIAAVMGFVLFRERLGRLQVTAVVILAVSVIGLSLAR